MDIRAQVTMQLGTGLSEDRIVNTWHYTGVADDTAAFVDNIHPLLTAFYCTTVATVGATLGQQYSEFVRRLVQVKYYNLADPMPRPPDIREFTMPTSSGSGYPDEVALVLSLRAAPPVTRRRRGRIYLGPFATGAGTGATATTPDRPAASLINTIIGAAENHRALVDALAGDYKWCIHSSLNPVPMSFVVGGHVDNAWDTQRRRGPGESGRTLWGS